MLLSDCMRSSSAASRRRPCCLPQRLRPCCSGRCLLPVRSPCAKWTDGKRWQKSQPFNALTLLPEEITSLRWRCRYIDFYQLRDTANPGQASVSLTAAVLLPNTLGTRSQGVPAATKRVGTSLGCAKLFPACEQQRE